MMQAIVSNYAAAGTQPATSPGVLEAQLNRYQIQLADWCNCPSGKTPEGKAIIQSLQDKADAVKAQIEKIAAAQGRPSASPDQNNANPIAGVSGNAQAAPAARATSSLVGGFLDTFV